MATAAGDILQHDDLERELDQIFFGDACDEAEANAEASTRGAPDQRRREIWQRVCAILDEGLDAARAKIIPTAVIDFPFCDNHGKNCKPPRCSMDPEPHMDLNKEHALFERGWVFEVMGLDCDTRLMLHGHTFLAWSTRGEIEVKKRADKLTSVNWQIAEYARDRWSQDHEGQAWLINNNKWRQFYRQKRYDQVLWRWREWSGDGRGFPSANLAQQGREPDAGLRQKYKRVHTLLRLADEAEVQETYSKLETNKVIRSHGQVVSEMDITPLITRRPRRDLARPRPLSLNSAVLSSLPPPAPVPSPFRVLLMGANVADHTQLKIREECEAVRQALENRYGADAWSKHVEFRINCVADASSLMSEVMQATPSVLMLSSHGETHGVWLSQGLIEARDLVEALGAINREVKAEEQIRLLVINACMSGPLAEQLSECVDFVIGHGTSEVADEDAIKFSTTRFRALGRGLSLYASFAAAKLASKPFELYAQRFSPQGFFLPVPDLKPTAASLATSQQQTLDTDDDPDYNELIHFLRSKGLTSIAGKFSKLMGMEVLEDLRLLKEEDLYDPELSFLKRWQKEKLMNLVKDLTACALSEHDSLLSGADTASEGGDLTSESDHDMQSDTECVVLKHPGNPGDFQEHMRGFILDFLDLMSPVEPNRETELFHIPTAVGTFQWSYCMLVWLKLAKESYFDESRRKSWLDCIRNPTQDRLMAEWNSCLQQASTKHSLWSRATFNRLECSKEFASVVFVTDALVQQHLCSREESLRIWTREILRDWFENVESASAFLLRANQFLREHIMNGIIILETPVETRSYVAFMRMPKLASLLLFAYLEVRKLDADASPAAGSNSALLHGFRMFVSSSRQIFGLTSADVPAQGARPTVFQGLRCLSRLSVQAWAMLGPMKTVREYAKECKALAVAESPDTYLKGKDWDPDDDESGAAGAADSHETQKKLGAIFCDDVAVNLIKTYVTKVKEAVSFYVDSASGEKRGIDGESIPLVLFSNKSFDEMCGADHAAIQEELCCPISRQIMQHPVKCSDGQTYERAEIEKSFKYSRTSPMTRHILECQPDDENSLWHEPDTKKLEEICKFKMKKHEEEERRKQDAEGEEEKCLLRQRLGVLEKDLRQKSDGENIHSADRLLDRLLSNSPTSVSPLACLIGPPASGKTVTMLQIVHAAAKHCSTRIHSREGALLPLFMRAAELSALLSRDGNTVKDLDLRQLVHLFFAECMRKGLYEQGVVNVTMEMFDLKQVLICIDGLDEAAVHRELIETCIDNAVRTHPAHSPTPFRVLLSTREHSYAHSRAMQRLGHFEVVKLQPLDEHHQDGMIRGRISPEKIQDFKQQLLSTAEHNPELATSPFLLSLMIEVYKEHGAVPSQRIELYSKQVQGIVWRCICIEERLMDGEVSSKLGAGKLQKDKLKIATSYLDTLAFVCQMRLQARDFKLEACESHVSELWEGGEDSLSAAQQLLFSTPIVGLLADVGDTSYRFSHLTLQEYLAARCAVRLYGHGARELLARLQQGEALFSRWKREVLQFTACLLPEEVFPDFCQQLLEIDDGTGVCCELVQDFLRERGSSEAVEQMMCDQMRKNRGTNLLQAGLCHPCPEMRSLVLSEMIQFCVPPNLFAHSIYNTEHHPHVLTYNSNLRYHEYICNMCSHVSRSSIQDMNRKGYCCGDCEFNVCFNCSKHYEAENAGCEVEEEDRTVPMLMKIAEDTGCVWHKRAASILSIAHIAQMKHCSCRDRTETIRWMLKMIKSGTKEENVHFALVKALGTMLKQDVIDGEDDDSSIRLQQEEESVLLQPDLRESTVIANALSDLNVFSEGLVDWLQREPCRVAQGRWPMKHVLFICEKVVALKDFERASRLAGSMLHQLHSSSFEMTDRALLLKGLNTVHGLVGADVLSQMFPFLESGDAEQRARVLAAAAELKVLVEGEESISRLVRCLLLDVEPTRAHESPGNSMLSYVLEKVGKKCQVSSLRENSTVFVFLLNIMEQRKSSGEWQETLLGDSLQFVTEHLQDFERKHDGEKQEQVENDDEVDDVEDDARFLSPRLLTAHAQSLDRCLEDFTPGILDNALSTNVDSCQHYCSASLWTSSGLLQETSADEIAAWLQLRGDELVHVAKTVEDLKHLQEPWIEGYGGKMEDGRSEFLRHSN